MLQVAGGAFENERGKRGRRWKKKGGLSGFGKNLLRQIKRSQLVSSRDKDVEIGEKKLGKDLGKMKL